MNNSSGNTAEPVIDLFDGEEPISDQELSEDPPDAFEAARLGNLDSQDVLTRLAVIEEHFQILGRQYGSGHLSLMDPPVEDSGEATRKLIWTTSATLTCQTSKGRNLKLKGFSLTLWRDGRCTFAGPMHNQSRHSNWRINFQVHVFFKSGHDTRPQAEAYLGSLSLNHGKKKPHVYRSYADSLLSLYDRYQEGELYFRFRIEGTRTN